jgi:hypothetical protein
MSRISVAGCEGIQVAGGWELRFPAGSGAPALLRLPELMSLHLHPEFGVKHFSGTMVYRKDVKLKGRSDGKRYFLDLGRVEVLAEVVVNGQAVGTVWKEPYRIEITKAVQPGENQLEIRVTNLWPNRMIGDEQLPEENQYSPFGPVLALPDWYIHNREKTGERITFCAWHSYRRTDPLLASGLLGPVKIFVAVEKVI